MKESIYNLSFEELKSFLIDLDEKAFRAEQLWNWLYVKGINELEIINNISAKVMNKIVSKYHISHFSVSKKVISKDGTKKWLFKLEDGKEVETVYIPDNNRGTICVSSQVGCTLSCSFCHTGTMKFIRNLSMSEILGQVIYVKNELQDWSHKVDKKKLTNIVFMGMGAKNKKHESFNGKDYIMETGLIADLSIVKAWKGDKSGNLIYRKTARNFNPVMATAGKITIAEVEELCEIGELEADQIHTPGIYVNRILKGSNYSKAIENLTFSED